MLTHGSSVGRSGLSKRYCSSFFWCSPAQLREPAARGLRVRLLEADVAAHGTGAGNARDGRCTAGSARRAPAGTADSARPRCSGPSCSSSTSKLGAAIVDQQRLRQAERRQVAVVGDVLPVVAEVRRGERLAVGPFVAGPKMQREDAVAVVVDALEDVGHDAAAARRSRRGASSRRRPSCGCRGPSPSASAARRRSGPGVQSGRATSDDQRRVAAGVARAAAACRRRRRLRASAALPRRAPAANRSASAKSNAWRG